MIEPNLIAEQYKNATNLDMRIQLHARFSINTYPWQRWLFDYMDLPRRAKVLELGCGTGLLWLRNLDRIPTRWEMTLTDFSTGMLDEARRALASAAQDFRFEKVDAQDLPYEDERFDAVVAHHMLYHVPDQVAALKEILRVIKPGGKLYASTVGEANMQELWSAVDEVIPGALEKTAGVTSSFTLESGEKKLAPYFSNVKVYHYKDALLITDPEPVLAYVTSSNTLMDVTFTEMIQATLRANFARCISVGRGTWRVTKSSGLLLATR